MAHLAVGGAGAADPQVVALIQGISYERVAVAAATSRFAAAAAKTRSRTTITPLERKGPGKRPWTRTLAYMLRASD